MSEQKFQFPNITVGEKLLSEFGRLEDFDSTCQDWEYTSPREQDLRKYVERYSQTYTTEDEKRVLTSFIFQSCNNLLGETCIENENYVRQVLTMLSKDFEITKFEFDYWSCWDTEDKEDRFYVAEITREFNVRIE
jgi:hypothetical protein